MTPRVRRAWLRASRLVDAYNSEVNHSIKCERAAFSRPAVGAWGQEFIYRDGGFCEITLIAASLALDGIRCEDLP